MSTRAQAFRLSKWYIDCAGDDGRTAIGYWASLGWRGVSVAWQAVTVYEPGHEPMHRSSLAGSAAPSREGSRLHWRPSALGCAFDLDVRRPPLACRLFESGAGFVDWRCDAPTAFVGVELDGQLPVCGTGYAEELTLTIPPWHLPIRELRWGRWMDPAADRSVVWIDWTGRAVKRTHVFVDGELAPEASVDDDCIRTPMATLTLASPSTLWGLTLADVIRSVPALHAIAPSSLLALRDTKWSSLGELRGPGAPPLHGRAIHERVTFR